MSGAGLDVVVLEPVEQLAHQFAGLEGFWALSELLLDRIFPPVRVRRESVKLSQYTFRSNATEQALRPARGYGAGFALLL